MHRFLTALVSCLLLSSCAGFADGSAEVRGDVRVPRCRLEGIGNFVEGRFPTFDLSPSFFQAERRGDVLSITIRRDARPMNDNDALAVDIRDVTRVTVGTPVEVRAEDTFGATIAPARLALVLKTSCPRFETGLLGRGTITFNVLDPRDGGLVDATFTVDLLDAHAARQTGMDSVLGSLRGRFRIPVRLLAEPG